MPKIEIDHESLDGIVQAGLQEMLEMMIDGYRQSKHEIDRKGYLDDIKAIEHVLKIYGA